MKLFLLSSLITFFFLPQFLLATHNRAGEIVYHQTEETTIEASIITYTKLSSIPADRDSLEICWGDGTCQWVERVNGPNGEGEPIGTDSKLNIYTAAHTYTEQGQYTVYMTDPNRNSNILNVNPPNSDNVPFHLQALISVLDFDAASSNHSPVLLSLPLDIAFTQQAFYHAPNGFDEDGDSLAYQLIAPLQSLDEEVSIYFFPNEIEPSADNIVSLDELTGMFVWDSPQIAGVYNIAIKIKEYRDGILIGYTIRDMQIQVDEGGVPPPIPQFTSGNWLTNPGDLINMDFEIDTEEKTQKVSASGGPFEVENPAVFTAPTSYQTANINANFSWQTTATHARLQPYQVIFRQEDNYYDTYGAVTLSSLLIYVTSETSSATTITPITRVKIYPNPTQEKLSIQFEEAVSQETTLRINNSIGQTLLNSKMTIGQQQKQLDLSSFSSGTYFLSIQIGEQSISHSFMVE